MYIIGIIIGLYFKISIAFFVIASCIIIIILLIFSMKLKYIIIFIFLIGGYIYTNILETNYEEKYQEIYTEAKIRGIILTNIEEKDYKYVTTIQAKYINNVEYKNIKLRLEIKKSKELKEYPNIGDEIEFVGQIEKGNIARNYKGFDYKEYLKTKGLYGVVTVDNIEIKTKGHNNKNCLYNIKNNMKSNMKKILNEEEASLCIGILIGDRENISEDTEDNFKKSNLTHMLAVSGSHITYIITAFSNTIGKKQKKLSKIITIIFLLFFMALTGFTASVMRASLMGIILLIGSLIYRKPDTINNLGISSLIILIINPYFIKDIGFLLSYAGTIGIIFFGDLIINIISKIVENLKNNNTLIQKESNKESILKKILSKLIKYLINSFSITMAANIMIIPIMAYYFSTISLTFWISNILAAPIMEVVTIFGFIVYLISLIFCSLAEFLGIFLNFFLYLMLKIAEISSNIPGSLIYIKTPYILECIFYYLFIAYIFNLWELKGKLKNIIFTKKIMLIIIVLVLIVKLLISIIPLNLRIYFVDVGQGDCTLIKTPQNKTILVDGGGSEFGNFDVGEQILLPYLLDRKITKIDYIMISHFDSDHVKGILTIIKKLNVKNIIISKQGENSNNYKEFLEIIKDKNINIMQVKKGDCIKIDKYTYFEILFPENNLIKENILNNNSIVAKLHCKYISMLFTGDIEEIAEIRLYELYKDSNALESTILKVAHHGSKSSSIGKFLDLVKPKIVFIGVGENNNFGHPNTGVIQRLHIYTKQIYRTDLNGEIELKERGKTININCKIK